MNKWTSGSLDLGMIAMAWRHPQYPWRHYFIQVETSKVIVYFGVKKSWGANVNKSRASITEGSTKPTNVFHKLNKKRNILVVVELLLSEDLLLNLKRSYTIQLFLNVRVPGSAEQYYGNRRTNHAAHPHPYHERRLHRGPSQRVPD